MAVIYKKRLKNSQTLKKKTCLLFYGCYGNGDDIILLNTKSNNLQYDSTKSAQILRKTDKNSRRDEQTYGKGAHCAGPLGFI